MNCRQLLEGTLCSAVFGAIAALRRLSCTCQTAPMDDLDLLQQSSTTLFAGTRFRHLIFVACRR